MIVDYDASKGLTLFEADDFKGFKLRLVGDETRPAIAGVTFVDDANVLIGVDLVPTLPGAPRTPEWMAGYRAMIDYAAKKGWIDAVTNSIRAHVERVS